MEPMAADDGGNLTPFMWSTSHLCFPPTCIVFKGLQAAFGRRWLL